jgi:hypothetical protein
MNEEDKKRFARYYPGYIEPQVEEDDNPETNENNDNNDKKNVLGYIDKIDIDKDKLVNDTIKNTK